MIAALKLYVKIFLLMGLPFGTIMTLFDLISGSGFHLSQSLYYTFFFGLWMSLFLVTLHLIRLRWLGLKQFSDANLGVKHHRVISTSLSFPDVLEKIKGDPSLGKSKIQPTSGSITLRTPSSWCGWGEDVTILPVTGDNKETGYAVSSYPALKTTVIDFGKNLQNITSIEKLLR